MKKLDSYLEELEKAMCLNRQHRPQNSNGLSHTSSNNLLLSSLYHPKGFEKITNVTVLGDLLFFHI